MIEPLLSDDKSLLLLISGLSILSKFVCVRTLVERKRANIHTQLS